MLYAKNNKGQLVSATKGGRSTCDCCGSPLIAKCGSRVVWHWSHKSIADCDSWSEGETLWHAAWKSRFDSVEVVMRRGYGEAHRADAVGKLRGVDTVIEFQHSTITAEEVEKRESFYGENMVWVLDGTKIASDGRIRWSQQSWPEPDGRGWLKFQWLHRKTSFDESSRQIFVDLGRCFHSRSKSEVRHGGSCTKDSVVFLKPWSDSGRLRRAGVFQDAASFDGMLEIKKNHDGYGWGYLISHRDFCLRYGGNMSVFREREQFEPVLKIGDCGYEPYFGIRRGYSPEMLTRDLGDLDWVFDRPAWVEAEKSYASDIYGWCGPQLEARRAISKEAVNDL